MSAAEIESAEATYKNEDLEGEAKNVSLTGKQKAVLWIFGAAFLVMVISFIPWEDLGVDAFVAGSASHDEVAEVTADDIAAQYESDKLGTLELPGNVKGTLTSTVTDNAGWSAFLTGTPLGQWYFAESTTWFLILAITIGRGWQPVVDWAAVPAGIAGGVAVSLLGAVFATHRASRVEPSEALHQ